MCIFIRCAKKYLHIYCIQYDYIYTYMICYIYIISYTIQCCIHIYNSIHAAYG